MIASIQPQEGTLVRAATPVALVFVGLSAAFAQPTPKVPACSQSMIVGTWQALFAPGASNPIAPGFPVYPSFACPVGISANGTLTTGKCTLTDNFTLTRQPSGSLTIDRTCHVIGSIAYAVCIQNGPCSAQSDYVVQTTVSLWRSTDGSRLSGFQSWSCSVGGRGCGRTPPANVLPFELIEGQ
jgi:hypothetical protein